MICKNAFKCTFLHYSDAPFELQQVILTTSSCLKMAGMKACCHLAAKQLYLRKWLLSMCAVFFFKKEERSERSVVFSFNCCVFKATRLCISELMH